MPPLEEWLNIVATCCPDAMFLEAPVTMNIAKTAGYRVAMVGGLIGHIDFAAMSCPDAGHPLCRFLQLEKFRPKIKSAL